PLTIAGFRADVPVGRMFSAVCHQLDSHSLHAGGTALGVCTRCTGIYFGFLAGMFAFPFFRIDRIHARGGGIWIVALIPMLFDVGGGMLGLWESGTGTRLVSGALFGIPAAQILTPGFIQA